MSNDDDKKKKVLRPDLLERRQSWWSVVKEDGVLNAIFVALYDAAERERKRNKPNIRPAKKMGCMLAILIVLGTSLYAAFGQVIFGTTRLPTWPIYMLPWAVVIYIWCCWQDWVR